MPKANQPAAKPDDSSVMDPDSHPFNGANPDDPLAGVDPDTGKKGAKKAADTVKVKIGDAELEMDPGTAAAFQALKKQNEDLYGYLKTMNQGSQQQGKPAATPDKDEDEDYETLLFTDPKAAVKKLRAQIKDEVKKEMTGQYNAVESEKQFWGAFYESNKDLKEHDFYVRAVLNREFNSWKDLPASEAAQKLAETVKKELLKMRGGKSDSDANFKGVEATGSRVNAKSASQNPEDVVPSIGEIIRKRQAARHKATFHRE